MVAWRGSFMSRARAPFCLVLCIALAAAACGDSASDGEPNASTNSPQSSVTVQPQSGGSLTFAAFSEISGLDPIVALGHGTSGGIQMAAVYDTLMHYNSATRKYENRMTESVVAHEDSTQWRSE